MNDKIIPLTIGGNVYPTVLDANGSQFFKNVESEEFVAQYAGDTTIALMMRLIAGNLDHHTALRVIAAREYSIYYVMELPVFARLDVHNPEWDEYDSNYWKNWRRALVGDPSE